VIAADAREALVALHGDRVRFDALMSRHTSLRVGGPADALVTAVTADEASHCVAFCAEHGLALTPLGGGFNTLVRDEGVDGIVLLTGKLRALNWEPDGALRAEAGVSHSQVMRACIERGRSGLEFGAGIPGTVGGWVAMNAGVPAREVRDALLDAEVATLDRGRVRLAAERLDFVYRNARGLSAGAVLLSARFRTEPAPSAGVRAAIDEHISRRRATQPLDLPSCGSVFKNPPGEHAGQLIEQCGLKGEREGGAQISCVHANFIVNRGGARASDVLALIERAREGVRSQTGIELETEVRLVGRES